MIALTTVALMGIGAPMADAAPEPRIINGVPADPGDFPFMAAVLDADAYRKQGAYQAQFCGASLTAPTVLVTAAHCVVDQKTGDRTPAGELLVSFGQGLRGASLRVLEVARVDVHPGYRLRTAENDIAVLTLAQPVTDIPLIPVVKLAQLGDYTSAGSRATVVGWGNTSATGNVFPESLRSGEVEIFPAPSCGRGKPHVIEGVRFNGFRSDEASSENMLCAAGVTETAEVIDACQGDSGGPLLVGKGDDRRLVGVVSWGERCASYFPGVYTRVSAELEFLRQTGAIPTIAPTAPPQVVAVGRDAEVRVTAVAPSDGSDVTGFAVSVVDPVTGEVRTCSSAPVKRRGTCSVTGLVNGTGYQVTAIYGSPQGNSPVSAPLDVIPTTLPTAGTIRDRKRDWNTVRFRVTPSDANGQSLVSDEVVCTREGRVVRGAITEGRARLTLRPGVYTCAVRIETAAGVSESASMPVRIRRS